MSGERRQLKGQLIAIRERHPHLSVKYVGDEAGRSVRLLLPEVLRAYLTPREVRAWVEPAEAGAEEAAEEDGAALRGGASAAAAAIEDSASRGVVCAAVPLLSGGRPLPFKWEQRHTRVLRVRPEKPNLPPLISAVRSRRRHASPPRVAATRTRRRHVSAA